MKKTVLFAAALFTVAAASAQTGEITSAKGENWLSQDGDWGLTFDANPLLNYAGNLFNGFGGTSALTVPDSTGFPQLFQVGGPNTIGNGLTFAQPGFAIQGKKLVDANTAYRGRIRIGFGSTKNTEVTDDVTNDDATVTVEDVEKNSYFNLVLSAGLEKRVGSTRVVGVYGAELSVGLGSSKSKYEYGNSIDDDDQTHTNSFGQGAGTTEVKNGSTFGLGLNAFAGIEWFAAPKLSLSGEYTWGLALTSTGFGETTTETWDDSANDGDGAILTTTTTGQTPGNDKTSTFSLDTGVSGARIGLNFYFQ